jgi:hypothetical protein
MYFYIKFISDIGHNVSYWIKKTPYENVILTVNKNL